MRILQVNTADLGGGAEAVARQLLDAYRARGHWSRLAVGVKRSDDPDIMRLPRAGEGTRVASLARRLAGDRFAHAVRDPPGLLASLRGSEDVNAPASWRVLDLAGRPRP